MSVRAVLVGALVVSGVVGCGDPIADHLESTGKQPYSEEADVAEKAAARDVPRYVVHADTICEEMDQAFGSFMQVDLGSEAGLRLVDAAVPRFRQGADRLALVEADEEVAASLTAAADSIRSAAASFEAAAAQRRAGDSAGFSASADAARLGLEAATLILNDVGVTTCVFYDY